MSDSERQPSVELTSQHDAFADALRKGQESNQMFVVLELIRQLQISQPDKATVQSTFSLITQILPALGNVASKRDLENISLRIGAIETEVGKMSRTSALNDRDVQQLKQGQETIKESVHTEAARLEKAGDKTSDDIKDLRKAIETLSSEVGKVRAENNKYLFTSVIAIILFIVSVATFFLKPPLSNQPGVTSAAQTFGSPTQKPASGP